MIQSGCIGSCRRSASGTPGAGRSWPSLLHDRPLRATFSASTRLNAMVQSSQSDGLHARSDVEAAHVDRRQALLLLGGGVAAASLSPAGSVQAAASPAFVYEDQSDKFTLSVPSGWASGQGALSGASGFSGATGERRTLVFFPDDPAAHDVNVSVVVTNVSVEFTKLGSFGTIDSFAGNLVSSQDRSILLKQPSWARKDTEPVQICKLIDSRDTGESYEVEYTIEKMPGPKRHLFSSVSLGSNGRYNRLYTVTGQCLEEDVPKYLDLLRTTVKSLKTELQTRN